MNDAERKRDARIYALSDRDLLRVILHDTTGDVTADERARFQDMLNGLCAAPDAEGRRECLSKKQRAWAVEVARRVVPLRAEDAPRGREVATPAILQNLPKAPPRRSQ